MPVALSRRSEAVDAYIAKAKPFARPILEQIRKAVREGAPEVEEQMKWSRPFFVYRGIILGNLAAFKEHCSFGLWGEEIAAELREQGVVADGAMGSFGRITDVSELPAAGKIAEFVRLAASKIDGGTRTQSLKPRPRVAKPELAVPDALVQAFAKNKAACAQFETMSPSCRREYCDWIADAKRDETRQRRVVQAVEMIAQGKGRNWKYES